MEQKKSPHPFLVYPDLTWPEVPVLPKKEKKSEHAWPLTEVVDWEQVQLKFGIGPVNFNKMPSEDVCAMHQLCLNIIFRYIVGASDLADRNFVYNNRVHTVTSIDEDTINKDINLSTALKGFKAKNTKKHIEEHWSDYFSVIFASWHQEFSKFTKDKNSGGYDRSTIFPSNWSVEYQNQIIDGMINRSAVLIDKERLLEMFNLVKKEKKKEKENKKKRDRDDDSDAMDFNEDENGGEDEEEESTPIRPTKQSKNNETCHLGGYNNNQPIKIPKGDLDEETGLMKKHIYPIEIKKKKAVAGRYGAKTNSGIAVDVVKSDFQKSIRMGNAESALLSFFEMYNMETIFPDVRAAKANRTNIINRMMICAAEDIGPANIELVCLVLTLCLKMQERRESRNSHVFAGLIEDMAASKKTRICSKLWHAYGAVENREMSIEKGLDIHPVGGGGGGEDEVNKAIQRGDPNIFNLAKKAFDEKETGNDDIDKIWEALIVSSDLPKWVVELMQMAYTKLSEKRPILQLALTMIVYPNSFQSIKNQERAEFVNIANNKAIYYKKRWFGTEAMINLLSCNYDYFPNEKSIDKHTAEGRRNNADRNKFVTEGALVENEHPDYKDDVLDFIYVNSNVK